MSTFLVPMVAGGGILWTILIIVLILCIVGFIFGRGRRL
jgi:hypothetical protein